MADTDKTTVYTVDPRIKNPQEDGIRIQAEALAQWIAEREIREFTLAGNSLGAIESAYLFSYLKKHAPDVKINGLLLFEALPIHDQTTGELVKGYLSDIVPNFLKTRLFPSVPKAIRSRAIAADSESQKSIKRDGKPWTMIRNLIKQEVRAMKDVPDEYDDVDVPVILVHGSGDKLSRMTDALSQQQETSDSTMDTNELMEDFSERSRVMKGLFPNAPDVRVLIGKKFGTHQLPGVRPSAVAKSALLHLRWSQDKLKR